MNQLDLFDNRDRTSSCTVHVDVLPDARFREDIDKAWAEITSSLAIPKRMLRNAGIPSAPHTAAEMWFFNIIQQNASVSSSGDEPEYAPRTCSLSDTDRLVWLRRNVSGFEMRRIGICMNDTGDTEEFRKRIDEVIMANANNDASAT